MKVKIRVGRILIFYCILVLFVLKYISVHNMKNGFSEKRKCRKTESVLKEEL